MHPAPSMAPRPRPIHRPRDVGRTGPEDRVHVHGATGGWDWTIGPTIARGISSEQAGSQDGFQCPQCRGGRTAAMHDKFARPASEAPGDTRSFRRCGHTSVHERRAGDGQSYLRAAIANHAITRHTNAAMPRNASAMQASGARGGGAARSGAWSGWAPLARAEVGDAASGDEVGDPVAHAHAVDGLVVVGRGWQDAVVVAG